MKLSLLYISICCLLLTSCGDNKSGSGNGPIILGDSFTIVTEKDTQYLKDDIVDFEPNQKDNTTEASDVVASKHAVDTPAITAKPVQKATDEKEQVASGYTVAFGAVKIVFEGISVNDATRQNAAKQDGLSYVVKSGDIEDSKVHVYGAKDISIKKRYQSRLTLSSKQGTVNLGDLGLYTSGWKIMSATKSGNQLLFSMNDLNHLSFSPVNNNKIKNATDRELRNRRTNRKVIQSWMKEIGRTRSANDAPCDIVLDNVQLQISGKGSDGVPFRKNIRLSI